MSQTIAEQVRAIIAEQAMLDPAEITMDARLDALGIDSLGLVEAIFAIEETFDIQVPFNANAPVEGQRDLSDVGSVIRAVEALVADRDGGA
jgi:acyl carrier protein